jgi:C4-dicarboxylate transporter DctM subunit
VAVQLADGIRLVASEPWMFLLLGNVALLLLGIFIEPLPALLLTAPLFLPPRSSKSISCTSAS